MLKYAEILILKENDGWCTKELWFAFLASTFENPLTMGTSVPMQGDGIPQDSQQAAQCIIKVPGQSGIHEDGQDLLLLVPYSTIWLGG